MSLARFLRRTQGTRGQIRAASGFGAPTLLGRGGRREFVPSIGSGLLLNMPLRKDTRMIYSAGGADSFSTETVDADGTYKERTAKGGLITGATANTARIEDDGVLAEGVRTNLCLQSEDFGTTWVVVGGVTVDTDVTTSPAGVVTADRLVGSATGTHRFIQTISLVDNLQYTFSCYLKQVGSDAEPRLVIYDATAPAFRAETTFQWSAGVLTVKSSLSGTSAILDAGGGWYRASVTCPVNVIVGVNTNQAFVYPDASNGAGAVLAWGAQFELGAFASSYIPTTTASVTRAFDALLIENSAEEHCKKEAGTIFVAYTPHYGVGKASGVYPVIISAATTVPSLNGFRLYVDRASSKVAFGVWSNAVVVCALVASDALAQHTPVVLAVCWDTDDFRLYTDGGDEKADTSGATPTALSDIALNYALNVSTSYVPQGNEEHLLIYNRAMLAAEIATVSAEITEWMS